MLIKINIVPCILVFFGLSFSSLLAAQKNSSSFKNCIYIGGGRQGLTYLKYERQLTAKKFTKIVLNVGLGGVPGDAEHNDPRQRIITSELALLVGEKSVLLEFGVEPSINMVGGFSYVDLNGIAGLRYLTKSRGQSGLFFQAGYNPRLFRTHNSDINVPVYLGVGLSF